MSVRTYNPPIAPKTLGPKPQHPDPKPFARKVFIYGPVKNLL